jgi:Fe-Mn family superoxide dismutase
MHRLAGSSERALPVVGIVRYLASKLRLTASAGPETADPAAVKPRSEESMKHQLPDLPYDQDALEPYMSAETLSYHHGKHHATYVEKLNGLIEGSEYEQLSLEETITKSTGSLFNNAAQAWNHTFFWHCLAPPNDSGPAGDFAQAIERDFGSVAALQEEFSEKLNLLFGSGWVWLIRTPDGGLAVESRSNAGNPMTDGFTPLLTCDMWEHAYYIDYRNAKAKYFEAFWQLVNWDFVGENFARKRPYTV